MRWRGRDQSDNVEDRRGASPRMLAGGGGLGVLLIIILGALFGINPNELQQIVQQVQPPAAVQPGAAPVDDEAKEFISVVLNDTEEVWGSIFEQSNLTYREPKLVIFSGQVNTQCGPASSAVGPFYCPADQNIYIDPTFFDELARRHDAPGDFAQAYVIAHEVAHHVQKLLGYSQIADKARMSGSKIDANRASVRLELQADFLAGVWANHAQRRFEILEAGDLQEAINAANQIGDDTLMRKSSGFVIPERFTHGSSAQRVRWFQKGYRSGDPGEAQELFRVEYDAL